MAVVFVDGAVDISIDLGDRLGVDDADLTAETLGQLRPILQELVRVWREDLLDVWPVDTGRSQASWTDRWEGLVWVLRNPVEYAEYVHNAGDDTEVWTFMEARAEELLDSVLPEIRGIIEGQQRQDRARGGRTRSLLGFAARAAVARETDQRVFQATVEAFRDVSSRERTKRQRRRLRAA